MTDYTPNLNLDLYEAADKPNLLDQYNSSMNKIDIDLSTPFTSARIADGAITSAKLYDGAVTTAKLADDSVTGAKIADGSITGNDFADGAITTAKLDDAAVTTAKIADEAVTTAKLDDAAVTTAKIADEAVTTAKLDDAAVTEDKLANNSVSTDKIADAAVTAAKIDPSVISTIGIPMDNLSVYKDSIIVAFGDSITRGRGSVNPATDNWPLYVANDLQMADCKNYCVDSAAYTRTGSLAMSAQLTTAAADTSYDKDEVKLVVICAGNNDAVDSGSDATIKSVSNSFNSTVKTMFPNAKIIMIPMLTAIMGMSFYKTATSRNKIHALLLDSARESRVECIPNAYSWGCGYPEYYWDETHVNETGSRHYADCFEMYLNGTLYKPNFSANLSTLLGTNISLSSDSDSDGFAIQVTDGIGSFGGILRVNGNIADGGTVIKLPTWVTGFNSRMHPVLTRGTTLNIANDLLQLLAEVKAPNLTTDTSNSKLTVTQSLTYQGSAGTIWIPQFTWVVGA